MNISLLPTCLYLVTYIPIYHSIHLSISIHIYTIAWYRSVVETLGTTREVHFNRPMTWLKPGMKTIVYHLWKRSGNVTYDIRGVMDKQSAVKAYHTWIEQVKLKIPPNQLLIHNSKDGWLPLCHFLNLYDNQCPYYRGEKYPYVNETEEFKKIFSILKIVTKWFDFTLGLLAGIIITMFLLFMYRFYKTTPFFIKQHQQHQKKKNMCTTSVIKMD